MGFAFADRLVNLVTGLGTAKDKGAAASFSFTQLDSVTLSTMHRADWLARKVVDIIPNDMTREWRDWQAEGDAIEKIEAVEKLPLVNLAPSVNRALQVARLYGGAGIFMGLRGQDPSEPLELNSIKAGDLAFLRVLSRHRLSHGQIVDDVTSELFGQPEYYEGAGPGGVQTRVHPSRVVRLIGAPVLDDTANAGDPWGDSILQVVYDALVNAGSAQGHIASLIPEAKVDVYKVPNLMANVGDAAYRGRVIERFSLANVAKSSINGILVDAAEEWEQKQINFAQLPELMRQFLQIAAAAADIPVTRLLGESPGGLNATGDSDLQNYYDNIAARQRTELAPALHVLDEVVIRSALGTRNPADYYEWSPLWGLSEKEKADIFKTKADAARAIAGTGGASPPLMPIEALSDALVNAFIEDGSLPGLEASIKEYGTLGEQPEDEGEEDDEAPAGSMRQAANDAAPRTLYVQRKLVNGAEFIAWAKGQGFKSTLPADELHVTIAYSRQALDWMKIDQHWSGDDKGNLVLQPGGPRVVEPLGDKGAIVLLFSAWQLSHRHEQIIAAGASHDFDDYQPHVTITYEGADVDLAKVAPYRGKLVFGPEIFEELNLDWKPTTGGGPTADSPFVGDAKRRRGRNPVPRRTHFDPTQARGGDGRWIDTGARLRASVPLAEGRHAFKLEFAPVTKPAATSKIAGADVRGFRHVISDQGVRHIRSRHPDIGAEDIGSLPQIVKATPVLSETRGVNGVPRLEYRATVEGKRYVYIAEVRRKSRRLEAITLYRG